MTNTDSALAGLHRPRLLIRAARFGLAEYRRTPALRRSFAAAGAHTAAQIVALLLTREAALDHQRRAGDAAYSVARHVEVLIALMAEARMLPEEAAAPQAASRPLPAPLRSLPRRAPEAQPKASGISALRLETKASSASRTPSSMAGA